MLLYMYVIFDMLPKRSRKYTYTYKAPYSTCNWKQVRHPLAKWVVGEDYLVRPIAKSASTT